MLIKKYLLLLTTFLYVSLSYANEPYNDAIARMPQSLKNGTADYQTVTSWVKDYLADANYSETPILTVKLTEELHCHDSQWILIEDTPACGNSNCSYFVFSKQNKGDQTQYRYLDEIASSMHILFCFGPEHSYLLQTSHMDGNEMGIALSKITNSSLIDIGKPIIINMHNDKSNATLWEKLSTKKVSEKELLDIFK